jgi:hypothetical protein
MIDRIINELKSYHSDYKELNKEYPKRLAPEAYVKCDRAINKLAPSELNKIYDTINNNEGTELFKKVEEDYNEMISSLEDNKEDLQDLFEKYKTHKIVKESPSGRLGVYSADDIKNMFQRVPDACKPIPEVLKEAKRTIKD